MNEIRLGPDDGYPAGTRIVFSLTPTVWYLDEPNGKTTPIVAEQYRFVMSDAPSAAAVREEGE